MGQLDSRRRGANGAHVPCYAHTKTPYIMARTIKIHQNRYPGEQKKNVSFFAVFWNWNGSVFSAANACGMECVLAVLHSPWGGRVEGWSGRSPGLGVPVAGSCSSRMSLMWKPEGRPEISFPEPSSSRLQHAKSISAIRIYVFIYICEKTCTVYAGNMDEGSAFGGDF